MASLRRPPCRGCGCSCQYASDNYGANDLAANYTVNSGTWSIGSGHLHCTAAGRLTYKTHRPADSGQPADAQYCLAASLSISTAAAGDSVSVEIGGYIATINFAATAATVTLSGPGLSTQTTTVADGLVAPSTLTLCTGASTPGEFYATATATGVAALTGDGSSPTSDLVSIDGSTGTAFSVLTIAKTSPLYQDKPPCGSCAQPGGSGSCCPDFVGGDSPNGSYSGSWGRSCSFCLTEAGEISINISTNTGCSGGEWTGFMQCAISQMCAEGEDDGFTPIFLASQTPDCPDIGPCPKYDLSISGSYTLPAGLYSLEIGGNCGNACPPGGAISAGPPDDCTTTVVISGVNFECS